MRTYRTVEEFEAVHRELGQVMQDLEKVATMMRSNHLAELNCHGDNIFNRRVAELQGWSTRLVAEVTEQTRALAGQRRSKADLMVDRAAREAASKGIKKRGLQASKSAPAPKKPQP